jgi:tetrahydromethanopterin S-methyltransferase subunit C
MELFRLSTQLELLTCPWNLFTSHVISQVIGQVIGQIIGQVIGQVISQVISQDISVKLKNKSDQNWHSCIAWSLLPFANQPCQLNKYNSPLS